MNRFSKASGVRALIVTIGVTLGLSGTALAVTGELSGHGRVFQSGTNRACVYLTKKACSPIGQPTIAVLGTHGDGADIKVACIGGRGCDLKLSLTTETAMRDGSIVPVNAGIGSGKSSKGGSSKSKESGGKTTVEAVTVATQTADVSVRKEKVVVLTLNASGQRLLDQFKSLRAQLAVAAHADTTLAPAAGQTVVFH